MVDENSSASAETRKPRATKRKSKSKRSSASSVARSTTPSRSNDGASLIIVYVILGLAVIGTSFYAGYLLGKSASGGSLGGSDVRGGEGTLLLVEYSDFQCPFCQRAVPTMEQLKQNYGDRIQIVYKHFPLESIHPDALNAAIASECVRDIEGEEAFWEYHDTLFANQQALDVQSLKRYATAQGIDASRFATCLDTKETEPKVRADMAEAQQRGVQGTPSFWIGDELVVGALPYDQIAAKVDEKLSGKVAPSAPAPQQPSAPQQPTVVDVATGNNMLGDADAPVTIVEFSDFQCPFCQRFYTETEKQLITQYVETGKVRIFYRHFPLGFHQNAQKSAEATECAAKQGQFWEMHDLLFDRGQGDGTGLNNADLKAYAAELGLDTTSFNQCLDNGETASIVQKDFAEGQQAGVSGTPSFFVNGKQIVGAQPFSVFQATIEAELAQ